MENTNSNTNVATTSNVIGQKITVMLGIDKKNPGRVIGWTDKGKAVFFPDYVAPTGAEDEFKLVPKWLLNTESYDGIRINVTITDDHEKYMVAKGPFLRSYIERKMPNGQMKLFPIYILPVDGWKKEACFHAVDVVTRIIDSRVAQMNPSIELGSLESAFSAAGVLA